MILSASSSQQRCFGSANILSSVRVHPARAVFNWTLANKMPNGPVKDWHYFRNPLADDLVRKVQE
jgi:hypothetical protein